MDIEGDLPSVVEDAGGIAAPEIDTTPVEAAPPSMEDVASKMGWRPKDDWRGDPEKWKPAHEFVVNTADVNHKLGNRLKGLEETIGTMARTSAQVTERALAKQRDELLAKREEAFDTGDRDGFLKADKELTELAAIPLPAAGTDYVATFKSKNDWFEKDTDATTWAVNRAGELGKQGISPERQLQIVEREAKNLFPDLYPEATRPAKAAPLNAPGNRGSAAAAKGFSALPADAQKAALDYDKRGIITKDEYARMYFEENGR